MSNIPVGAGWFDLVHPDDRERMDQHFADVLAERKRFQADYRIIRMRDRKERWVSGLGELTFDAAGKPATMLGTIQDITEGKHAEQEREQLELQLLQAQKIESVGRLAGGIAHDIKQHAHAHSRVRGNAGAQIPDGDERREDLAEITGAANRVKDMTQQLLAFARKQTLEVRPLDVNVVISRFGRMLRRTLRENILIKLNLAPSVGTVLGDEGQLEQVLMNLAVNAQDAMPGGGVVIISTKDVAIDEPFARTRPGLSPGRYVVISVADTGMGMDSAILARIYEPFYTTKEPGRGTGWGSRWSTDHQAAQGLCRSRERTAPGCDLPVVPADHEVEAGHEAAGERTVPQGGSETILVVEDQEQVLRLVAQMLGERGYRVLTALSGQEALEKAGAFPPVRSTWLFPTSLCRT